MIKLLKVDEQTINDLSIFGRAGKSSIYEIYNKTTTQGGSRRLEALFREPLSDVDAINARVEMYRFFSTGNYSFPVDATTIGTMAYYMENEDVRSQLQTGSQSVSQRLKDIVAADTDYVFVNDGVQATLRLFHSIRKFVIQLDTVVAGTAYETHFLKLKNLIESAAFVRVRQHESEKYEARLNSIVLGELDKLIRFEHRDKILELLDILFDLDVYISVGLTARRNEFHFAEAKSRNSGTLSYKQVYHPHVHDAIANDLRLDASQNVLFLTGANMAGKSTLMKSIGVALYLGHMGFPVAAQRFEFAVRDGIYTSINLSDNLNQGASHYYAEVLRVKEVARELSEGHKLFVIFDELFRGTNVKDAYDASIVLTSAFCKKSDSQFIISTHIMEAGEVLRQKPLSIQYQYLPTEMKDNVPVYTRRLRDGITADRQGMIIIQNEGILEMLEAGLKHKRSVTI